MNDSNEQAQERYFQAAASWDADSRNAERLSLKRYKALGIGAVVFAAIMGVAVTTTTIGDASTRTTRSTTTGVASITRSTTAGDAIASTGTGCVVWAA